MGSWTEAVWLRSPHDPRVAQNSSLHGSWSPVRAAPPRFLLICTVCFSIYIRAVALPLRKTAATRKKQPNKSGVFSRETTAIFVFRFCSLETLILQCLLGGVCPEDVEERIEEFQEFEEFRSLRNFIRIRIHANNATSR